MDAGSKTKRSASLLRVVGSAFVLAILALAILRAGRSGLVSLLTVYAAKTSQVGAADAALKLDANDTDAHFVRGAMLEEKNDVSAAIEEYKQAITARPEDYLLWLSLARVRESNGDVAGAIGAARQATRLAPYYARTRWVLGNILVRGGKADEGFNELRLAGASDRALLASIIDLEMQLTGDAETVKRAIQPDSPESYKALADYFKKHDKANEAIEMFRAAGPTAEPERRQYLQELIAARSFKEAALLWSIDHAPLANGQLADSGFEQSSNLDVPGFGWHRENKAESLTLSLDANNPGEGRFSLRVDFNGESDSGAAIISQLILVEPRAHYRLRFAARTERIVSGGLPYVAVLDAGGNNALGQTSAFPKTKTNWQDYAIDFQAGESTSTIQLILRRRPCSSSSCPVFGRLWLDNFSLEKL